MLARIYTSGESEAALHLETSGALEWGFSTPPGKPRSVRQSLTTPALNPPVPGLSGEEKPTETLLFPLGLASDGFLSVTISA